MGLLAGCTRRSSLRAVAVLLVSVTPWSSRAGGQGFETTDRLRLRAGPTLTDTVIRVLNAGTRVSLTIDSTRNRFAFVRTTTGETGWVAARFLTPAGVSETTLATEPLDALLAASFPKCGPEAHYRWAQKIAVDLQNEPITTTTVGTILNQWGREPDLEGHSPDPEIWCGDRIAGEERVYRLTGWVRRIKKEEADGDWHVEVTSAKTSPVEQCVIVEIPSPDIDPIFQTARDGLDALVPDSNLKSNGDTKTPVRVTFEGAAFYDGWHGGDPPVGHGRCNSTVGATWELHPVFRVTPP